MGSREPKTGLVVQEGAGQEELLGVAVRAHGPKAAEVRVAVAVDALGPGPGQHLGALVAVARLAGQQVVGALDAKRPEVVVDAAIGQPRGLGVTAVAVSPLLSIVNVEVAVSAGLGRTHILVLEVALPAIDDAVGTEEFERAPLIVVEAHLLRPPFGRVTLVAGLLELALVEVVVAIGAGGIDGAKVPTFVARGAGETLVLAAELEPAQGVVEVGDTPLREAPVTAVTAHVTELFPVQIQVTERAIGRGVILGLRPAGVTPITRLVGVLTL
jgi:hypothetical protein